MLDNASDIYNNVLAHVSRIKRSNKSFQTQFILTYDNWLDDPNGKILQDEKNKIEFGDFPYIPPEGDKEENADLLLHCYGFMKKK